MAKLNDNLRRRRKQLGLTLQQVGDEVGVTRATVQRYETGDISHIESKMIVKLANALRTTPHELMGWDEPLVTKNKKLDELFTLCVQMNERQVQCVLDIVYALIKGFGDS